MISFHKIYRPLTSRPFLRSSAYTEYAPCEALKPYIVCFWGMERTKEGTADQEVLVIPDTSVDVIIEINHTKQSISSRICGIQDHSFLVGRRSGNDVVSSFAVRFHFWAVRLFINMNMKEIYNQMMDFSMIETGWSSCMETFAGLESIREKIVWMENYLLGHLDSSRYNSNLYNSVQQILASSGRTSVKEICEYSCISQRQMERIFQQETGASIKRMANMVRYQNVWKDIVEQKSFAVQDAVYRYGYSDQSHLLNEFKRFHGVSPDQARKIAAASIGK
ncbi:helix-turn-helix domain-containing protein [Clostridium sp. AM58-1XD]|uniref:helix-turn-helix domain-containing protein n=1 Tax=Clostridium sp. AM58-1XD TaxID=2292307 RepID=UPI000E4C95E2|nr:helix-turn-helix domain-containing protein [Clostridium sp. AM58-1XD]RGY99096.1 AraC family transcriptional regulator [Clostridium sp. AM58-1XD]